MSDRLQGRGNFLPPIHEQPGKSWSWIRLSGYYLASRFLDLNINEYENFWSCSRNWRGVGTSMKKVTQFYFSYKCSVSWYILITGVTNEIAKNISNSLKLKTKNSFYKLWKGEGAFLLKKVNIKQLLSKIC